MTAPRVRRLPANTAGRDFVVGDIHGAFDLVLEAMRKVRFNPNADRLFSVGDLIDRGAGSWRAARFLSQPYIHAVRGNHEQGLIELYEDGEPSTGVFDALERSNYSGMGWLKAAGREGRQAVVDAISRLPVVIETSTPRGTVGLVHADVPRGMDWRTFVCKVEEGDPATLNAAVFGRERIQGQREDGVRGIGRVFVGHTIQWGGPRRYGNVYAVDTGAVFGEQGYHRGGALTFAQVISPSQDFSSAAAGTVNTLEAPGEVALREFSAFAA